MGDIALICSQNLRIVGVGKDLLRCFTPSQLLQQGQLELVDSAVVRLGFEYLQGWRLHDLSGQPGPLVEPPQGKKVVSCLAMGISCVLICARCLVHCQVWLTTLINPGRSTQHSTKGADGLVQVPFLADHDEGL